MGNSIFDWEEEEEKPELGHRVEIADPQTESPRETTPPWNGREFEQPAEFADHGTQDPWKTAQWNDSWDKVGNQAPVAAVDHRESSRETAPWSDPKPEKSDDSIHQTAENPLEIPPWEELAFEGREQAMIPYQPEAVHETTAETTRHHGLAWSAGIVFFSSIVFMLFLGWLADLVFGSSPWGIVSGIVLGSILGFIQFFRITSQIFNSAKAESAMRPLMPRDDEER